MVELARDAVIGGRYLLEQEIGEGGMGRVWRARHLRLARPVAVKFVELAGTDPDKRRDRFAREARLAASVRHRCVVDIIDYGETEDGEPFMVMELLEGETLAHRIRRTPDLTQDQIVKIFDMLMGGLAAIHDKGIVHRDLKPENVFLARDSDGIMPKLMDFGISRISARESDRPPGLARNLLTDADWVLGTPEYMSPEQARGLKQLDKRSDVFAMGVLMYEAFAGCLPFEADTTTDVIAMIIRDESRPLTDFGVDRSLAEVVALAMAKDPAHRLQDARAIRVALRAATQLTLEDLNDSQLVGAPPIQASGSLPTIDSPARGRDE